MKTIHDDELLQKYIRELELEKKFDLALTKPFLCSFEKGELLSGPYIRQRYLLFLVAGIAQIYGIGIDGRKIPVNLARKGTVIGDVEFCSEKNSPLFSEVIKDLLCVGISITGNREYLRNNVRFLQFLLESVSSKVYLTRVADAPAVSVEEKLLHYMREECENHILEGVEHATLRLTCSRRQLQRVLSELCEQGMIRKIGKGKYRLCENS